MEFLDVPLVDDDFFKLLVRFAINLAFLTLVVRFVYFRHAGSKSFLFTYYMVNIMVFFICFTLKKFDLGLGMALGLFAIFGILRYRTDAIPIKEMTYLFIVIGLGAINALANKQISYAEVAFVNLSITGLASLLESIPLLRREIQGRILYDKIDHIKPENYAQLVADIEQRTGLKLSRLEMGKIDFLNDTVVIDLYYYPHEQEQMPDVGISVGLRSE